MPFFCILKELQKSSERRRQLSLENFEIKAQISEKIGQLSRNLEANSPTESRLEVDFVERSVGEVHVTLILVCQKKGNTTLFACKVCFSSINRHVWHCSL